MADSKTLEGGMTVVKFADFDALSVQISLAIKRQRLIYYDLALQIGVSVSTIKRMVAAPQHARAGHLAALLRELGINVWIEQ